MPAPGQTEVARAAFWVTALMRNQELIRPWDHARSPAGWVPAGSWSIHQLMGRVCVMAERRWSGPVTTLIDGAGALLLEDWIRMDRLLPHPRTPVGYRRDGRPIFPTLGADPTDPSNQQLPTPSTDPAAPPALCALTTGRPLRLGQPNLSPEVPEVAACASSSTCHGTPPRPTRPCGCTTRPRRPHGSSRTPAPIFCSCDGSGTDVVHSGTESHLL
jgi:hypothetical protein